MRAPGMRTVARGSLRVVSMRGVQSMPVATPSPPCPPLEGEGSRALEPSPSRGGLGGDGFPPRCSFSRSNRHRLTNIQLMPGRSEEHTSELQSLMRISYAVFCLKKKKKKHSNIITTTHKK